MSNQTENPLIAIACGGTGGHLFPGIAVGEELVLRNCDVLLLVSAKEVDQQAVKNVRDMSVATLPAVGLTGKNFIKFAGAFWQSYRASKNVFAKRKPAAVLAMGGFTSAPPVLAAKHLGAKTFLHDSNSIPGKANRWLAHFADQGFVYFHGASTQLSMQRISTIGMPVRPQFAEPVDSSAARMALGLSTENPVLLVMGGSQGASGINDVVLAALPLLAQKLPNLQFLHLTGPNDLEKVQGTYAKHNRRAVVRPFLTEMELALGAATVAVSRAGASSLAEIASMRVPSILIPYPHAADDHQMHNALECVASGAARCLTQSAATPQTLAHEIVELVTNEVTRTTIQNALARWHTPTAAADIADCILSSIGSVPCVTGQSHTEFNIRKEAKCSI